MRKITLILALGMSFLGGLSFISCVSRSKSPKAEKLPERVIGNSKDDHGCLTSAGYQWSELLKDCIRPFEKGVKLSANTTDDSSFGAYIVFNADSSKVEVFMPRSDAHPILKRKQIDGQYIWKAKDKDITIRRINGSLSILQKDQVVYKEK